MKLLKNPILSGFHPDPCICRRNDDYYLAVSSFEWFPGIPIYHSKDLKNWRLLTHCLKDNAVADLRRLPSAKGIWAPCLTWCEEDGLFYLMYSIMNSMNARFFDVDNYLITAPSIEGPWCDPIYIHSAGFDPSMFHDLDGRKWITSLEWETRDGYHKPGMICLVEYDKDKKHIIGIPKRIWSGGTKRGCIEGPHIYKHNGYYYIMCAEGGTGYGHSVTIGRATDIMGPYEADPYNPILTSTKDFDEMDNDDAMKLNRYNKDSYLQKSGHGSIVETNLGEVYMFHHCGRPFLPELRCTLGRETCIQKMEWTKDNWLRLEGGGNMAKTDVIASELPEQSWEMVPSRYDFDEMEFPLDLYSPRVDYNSFMSLSDKRGFLSIRGQESLSSLNRASLIARKLTSLHAIVETKLEFNTETYQQYAGLLIYYDNMDYIMLRKIYNEELGKPVLDLLRVKNGERYELLTKGTIIESESIYLKLTIQNRELRFSWSIDGVTYEDIGDTYDTSEFSDEYCKYGEFTGTFVGLGCVDALLHEKCAYFDFFEYRDV